MVEILIGYEGELRCVAKHGPSGAVLETDAPVDNCGRGESFSPTDLVATALGTCVGTIMGIIADRHALDLSGMKICVKKTMVTEPIRRIGGLEVVVHGPAGISSQDRVRLENAARHCPVHKSLHPDIHAPIIFQWTE